MVGGSIIMFENVYMNDYILNQRLYYTKILKAFFII